jgi:hypothetical protein
VPQWAFQLSGDSEAREYLLAVGAGPGLRVRPEGETCWVEGDALARLGTADEVTGFAERLIHAVQLNFSLGIVDIPDLRLQTVADLSEGEGRKVHYSPRLEFKVPRETFRALVAHHRAPRDLLARLYDSEVQQRLLQMCHEDEAVALACEWWVDHPHDFRTLYCVYELVERDLGGEKDAAQFAKHRGVGNSEWLKQFKHTANSARAIGTQARHGNLTQHPPAHPMPLHVARGLVRDLLVNWLLLKCEPRPES